MYAPQLTIIGHEQELVEWIRKAAGEHYEIRVLPQEALDTPAISSPRSHLFLLLAPHSGAAAPLIEKLRSRFPGTPVLLLIRHPSRKDIIEAFRHGVSDFLIPPISVEEFQGVLRTHAPAFRYRWQLPLQRFLRRLYPRLSPRSKRKEALTLAHGRRRPESIGIVPDLFVPGSRQADAFMQHDLSIRFFGSFEIHFKDVKLKKMPGRKVSSLLAYLLLHHQGPVHREVLMGLFWGDNLPSSARNSLNVAIHHIRRHFARAFPEQEIILYKNENYSINPELNIVTDVELFISQWRKGRIVDASQGLEAAIPAYNKAAGLYRGDFLEELRYEEWCGAERDNLQETYLFLLDRLSNFFLREGSYTAAINLCKKALAKDSCLEDMHRRLITCYDRLDYRDLAIRQYYRCEETLKKELDVRPTEETKALFLSISQV